MQYVLLPPSDCGNRVRPYPVSQGAAPPGHAVCQFEKDVRMGAAKITKLSADGLIWERLREVISW